MKLNGNTSKRSAAAKREAADFAAQERSAHRSGANRSAQSEAAARRAAAPGADRDPGALCKVHEIPYDEEILGIPHLRNDGQLVVHALPIDRDISRESG